MIKKKYTKTQKFLLINKNTTVKRRKDTFLSKTINALNVLKDKKTLKRSKKNLDGILKNSFINERRMAINIAL